MICEAVQDSLSDAGYLLIDNQGFQRPVRRRHAPSEGS
jgi:hypothetical protein